MRSRLLSPWKAAAAALAGLLLAPVFNRPPATQAEVRQPQRFHQGRLLVASSEMSDPRFAEAVIYLVKHDADGAMGLVINRPLAKGPVDDLLQGMGAMPRGSKLDITLHYGGPVSSGQGFLLHSDDVTLDSSVPANNGLAMTADVRIIEAIGSGTGPRRFLFMLGYAGWAPGQLEAEIQANSWFTVEADQNFIFGTEAEKKWRQATDKRQIPT